PTTRSTLVPYTALCRSGDEVGADVLAEHELILDLRVVRVVVVDVDAVVDRDAALILELLERRVVAVVVLVEVEGPVGPRERGVVRRLVGGRVRLVAAPGGARGERERGGTDPCSLQHGPPVHLGLAGLDDEGPDQRIFGARPGHRGARSRGVRPGRRWSGWLLAQRRA